MQQDLDLTAQGRVFDIQRYSTHDGPGIRTTLFLKGCPLRCRWCHNPESILSGPQIMFDASKCLLDLACVQACPHGALHFVDSRGQRLLRDAGRAAAAGQAAAAAAEPAAASPAPGQGAPGVEAQRLYDADACRLCGACVDVCYAGALELVGRAMTVAEARAELGRDQAFYAQSGGGITLSGGEPLLQFDFSLHLLAACRAAGMHTALDTTAYCPWERLRAVLEHTDLVLLDLKHMDSEQHRVYTGVPNDLILENAQLLAAFMAERQRAGTPPDAAAASAGPRRPDQYGVWVRVPVIPGANDDAANMLATARFVGEQMGGAVRAVELLGYHRLGNAKHQRLGTQPDAAEWAPPGRARLDELSALWREALGPGGAVVRAR